MNRAIFMFLDRIIMSGYFLLTLYIVATSLMGAEEGVDLKSLAILFAFVSSGSMIYLIIRSIFKKPAKRFFHDK